MTKLPATPPLFCSGNISVDVDDLHCYRAIHGLADPGEAGPSPVWTVGIDRARRLFEAAQIEATFFVVGRDLKEPAHRDLACALAQAGHELANHTQDHPYDLRHLQELDLHYQIGACDDAIADITGVRPVGFRTPGYNVSGDIIAFSRRAGHRYDASIFPCVAYWVAKAAVMRWRALRGEPSHSSATDPRTLLAPRQPYFPDPLECWRPAAGPMSFVEIPVAVFAGRSIPIIGTSLHLLDTPNWERIWPLVDRSFPRFFNLEMHAIDFIDAHDLEGVLDARELIRRQPDLRIPWEVKRERYERVFSTLSAHRSMGTLARAVCGPDHRAS